MLRLQNFQGKRICVAVSGGADSVALLHYLKAESEKSGYALIAVHCEHGIRGEESLRDMRFVQSLCREWEIPLELFTSDCVARAKNEKLSLETAARKFRYESFSALLREGKADYIATAHHLNDEAETVLFRLARGTALGGAAAMQPQTGKYLRPFLDSSKEEILEYVRKNGLSFVEDSTNLQTDATRNKIRLEILPKLEESVEGAARNIARFATLAKEDDELLYELSAPLLQEESEGITILFCDKKPLFTRACLTAMKKMGVEKDYASSHLQALFALQDSERGARLDLPKLRAEKREKGVTLFFPEEEFFSPRTEEKKFDLNGFDGGRYEVNVFLSPPESEEALRFDLDKLPSDATFRFRREGDVLRKFGGLSKSLKKLFNEKKIPPKEREYLPLIASKESGRVYAVCGVEIAEEIKVDESTRQIVYISTRKKENGNAP